MDKVLDFAGWAAKIEVLKARKGCRDRGFCSVCGREICQNACNSGVLMARESEINQLPTLKNFHFSLSKSS